MRRFRSSAALKRHFRRNLGKPAFYSDTVHFYRLR
jgi:hypothetical protein